MITARAGAPMSRSRGVRPRRREKMIGVPARVPALPPMSSPELVFAFARMDMFPDPAGVALSRRKRSWHRRCPTPGHDLAPGLQYSRRSSWVSSSCLRHPTSFNWVPIARDPSGPSASCIVVIQEIFGVNHHIRAVCDRLAGEGYTALALVSDAQEKNFESGYTPDES